MKKIAKVIGIIIALLLAVLIITPFFFKDTIKEIAKEEINKNVNAVVDFGDVGLSLFSNFPDFTFSINDLSVIGIEEFKDKTLLKSEKISLTLDLASVFAGNYKVKEILIDKANINLISLKNGKSNWDIAIESEDSNNSTEEVPLSETSENSSSDDAFSFAIDLFQISNTNIIYNDLKEGMSSTIKDFDLKLGGDFSENNAKIDLSTSIDELSYKMDGVKYFNKAKFKFSAEILSDLKLAKYTFKENSMLINDVLVNFDGYVSMPGDDIYTDIKFNTPNTEFKSFLSLIPAFYTKGYEDIKADGKFSLDGWAKGIYNDKSMPAFDLNINVMEAKFQYPDLPKAVKDINIITNISSPTSDLNGMKINVSKFHFNIAGNPMDISMILKTPMTDPNIDVKFIGKMNLATIKDVYPMEGGMKMSGVFKTNIKIKGKQSDIDKGRYNKFIAQGSMKLKNMKYTDNDYPNGVLIHNASLDFSPRFIRVNDFRTTYNKNTIKLKGRVSNYMSYALSDGTLKGDFELNADFLNLNELMTSSSESEVSNTGTTENKESTEEAVTAQVEEAFDVPANINMELKCIIGRILYDKINIKTVYGMMTIKDKKVELDNLKMDMLGGRMEMNGSYNSTDIKNPQVNFVMGMQGFNIKKTYKAMDMVQKLAPIMENASGNFSTIFVYSGKLQSNMEPDLSTVNANGLLSTSKLTIKGAKSIERLADQLKVKELRTLTTSPMSIPFKIVNGDLIVSEFKTTINDMPLTASGTTKLSQEIDYKLRIDVPRENLGSDVNSAISQIEKSAKGFGIDVSASKTIIVKANITGTATDPKVGLDFDKSKDEVKNQAKDAAKKETKKEADKQLGNASKEADKAIENSDLSDEEKEKAKKLKKKLEDEAKKLIKLW